MNAQLPNRVWAILIHQQTRHVRRKYGYLLYDESFLKTMNRVLDPKVNPEVNPPAQVNPVCNPESDPKVDPVTNPEVDPLARREDGTT